MSGNPPSALVVRAPLAPLLADASVRAEQVTQLLLGETAELLETRGEWRRLRAHRDGYEGWANVGYLLPLDAEAAERWRAGAQGWSEGAQVDVGGRALPLPLGARVALEPGAEVTLPDGRRATLRSGYVRAFGEIANETRDMAPERWALVHFEGVPYEWGGRTPWGVDCSGLVQTAFAARGLVLPRDASQQVACGEPVEPAAARPGDLLFFRGETTPNITHVAFVADAGSDGAGIVHSTIACGGVLLEPCGPGSRAAALMERVVAVRRILSP